MFVEVGWRIVCGKLQECHILARCLEATRYMYVNSFIPDLTELGKKKNCDREEVWEWEDICGSEEEWRRGIRLWKGNINGEGE